MSGIAFALAFSGFVALCLSMDKYQVDLSGAGRASAAAVRWLKWTGWALIMAAFAIFMGAYGWTIGPLWWLGALTLSGAAISLGLLPYRPHWIKPAALALPLIALVLMLLSNLG